MVVLIGIIVLVVIVVGWAIGVYNRLTTLQTQVDNSWSQIDVQLQRRNDLIPNLINTVKGAANFEKNTLDAVIKARQQVINLPSDASREDEMQLQNQLSQSLKSVFALAEAYPDLKSNASFNNLMEELSNTENKISYSRQLYNNNVGQYNNSIRLFPGSLVASFTHFEKHDYLQVPEAAKENPQVNFDEFKPDSAVSSDDSASADK